MPKIEMNIEILAFTTILCRLWRRDWMFLWVLSYGFYSHHMQSHVFFIRVNYRRGRNRSCFEEDHLCWGARDVWIRRACWKTVFFNLMMHWHFFEWRDKMRRIRYFRDRFWSFRNRWVEIMIQLILKFAIHRTPIMRLQIKVIIVFFGVMWKPEWIFTI